MNSEALVKVIDFWRKAALSDDLYPRFLTQKINLGNKEVVDLIGPRRSGKSSVLKLIIKDLPPASFLYINFEDPFFVESNGPELIESLVDTYKEYFGAGLKYLFFDEIQNIKYWEKAVRKLRDAGLYKIFVTGSSAKLLSRELATLISGRHLSYELLPLSFDEYLRFRDLNIASKKDLILNEKKILNHFQNYLSLGGFPEVVLNKDVELLKQYYRDILEKDILARYEIRDKEILEKMGVFLLSNSAKTVSIASLKKLYGLSYQTVSSYVDFFQEAFLLFELPLFSFSLKTQQKALKKIYAIDAGLANAVSFRFSEDKGRALENTVFLHLKKIGAELFYYKDQTSEVDFVIKDRRDQLELVQVVWEWSDERVKARELKGLENAMQTIGAERAIILTFADKGSVRLNGKSIKIMPVYEWLLNLAK